jgi:hypothetical protein
MEFKCTNCGVQLKGIYCHECGEKRLLPQDRSLKVIMAQLGSNLFNIDNKILSSLKWLLLDPGRLSFTHTHGPRKKYLSPVSMFILLSVIYFLFPVFQTFNSTLSTHLNYGFYNEVAQAKVESFTNGDENKYRAYEISFNESTANYGKLAIFIFVILLSAPLLILNFSRKHFFADHIISSFEINSFLILINTILLPLVVILLMLAGIKGANGDEVVGPLLALLFMYFLVRFHKKYYRNNWGVAFAKSIIITFVMIYALDIYRGVVFFLTHWNIT